MSLELTAEQIAALNASPDQPIRVEDPTTQQIFFVYAADLSKRAMEAIEEKETWELLQKSIAQADAGESIPLAEADKQMRTELGYPERT